MKIVCLIRQKPPAIYFVNTIHAKHPVSLVVAERPGAAIANPAASTGERLREYVRNGRWSALFWSLLEHLSRPVRHIVNAGPNRQLRSMYNKIFGKWWQELDPAIPVLWVQNINDEAVRERLEREKPDILLDHGTSIVKPHILSLAPVTLNLHWGLSPYYRGTNCTNWAFLNRDPQNIGVTIHKLAMEVDGGDIVGQARVAIEKSDTVRSINTKLTRAGTNVMIRALNVLARGKPLSFHKQDLSVGSLTRGRDYTKEIEKKVLAIERKGLGEILEHPSRKEQIIVEFS